MSIDKTSANVDKTTDDPKGAPVVNPEAAAAVVTAVDPRLLVREQGLLGYWSEFKRKMKAGELGSLPVIVGLAVICVIFQMLNSNFLSAQNINDITVTMVGTGMISVGIVFVLLLGEIDLSVGSVSGAASALMAVLAVNQGWPEWAAILLAVGAGVAIGALHGFFFAVLGAPAFAVTLAGLLFWLGFMLKVLGEDGTINLDGDGLVAKPDLPYYFSDIAAAYGLARGRGRRGSSSPPSSNKRREAAGRPVPAAQRHRAAGRCCWPGSPFAAAYMLQPVQGPAAGNTVVFLPFLVGDGLRAPAHRLQAARSPRSAAAWRPPARGYQRHRGADLRLRGLRWLRGDRRSVPGLEDRLGEPERRYW